MRDLSIHIAESSLRLILGDLEIPDKIREEVITHILCNSKKYSCTNRLITISNELQKKEATRIVKTNISDTKLLANTLLFCRRKLHHKGVKQVQEGTKDWLACKDIADNANIFCNDFGLDKRAGYAIYLDLVLSKTKIFAIPYLNRWHEDACNIYEATVELHRDPTPVKTKELYDIFNQKAVEISGLQVRYFADPTKYVFFKRAKDFCESVNAPYEDFIQAQYDGLEFVKAIPIPEQLVGPKAIERLQRFAFKEGKVNMNKKGGKKINWAKIREGQEL